MSAIANKYADKVEAGKMNLEDVPKLWREKVRLELEKRQQVELEPVPEEVVTDEVTETEV